MNVRCPGALGLALAVACAAPPATSDAVDAAEPTDAAASVDAPGPPPRVQFQISPPTLFFDPVPVGAHADADFTILNFGSIPTGPLRISLDLSRAPDEFLVVSNDCVGRRLAPGERCTITMRFAPRAEGERAAGIEVRDDSTFAAAGALGVGAAEWTPFVQPASMDFGDVALGGTSPAVAGSIVNHGDFPVAPMALTIVGADASAFALDPNGCGTSLGGHTGCTPLVSFTPRTGGDANAALDVDIHGVHARIVLHGRGIEAPTGPVLTVVPRPYDFGPRLLGAGEGEGLFQWFTVANTGTAATGALAVSITGTDAGEFVLEGDPCVGAPLAAGSTCRFGVYFRPSVLGDRSALLRITPAGGADLDVALTGQGSSS